MRSSWILSPHWACLETSPLTLEKWKIIPLRPQLGFVSHMAWGVPQSAMKISFSRFVVWLENNSGIMFWDNARTAFAKKRFISQNRYIQLCFSFLLPRKFSSLWKPPRVRLLTFALLASKHIKETSELLFYFCLSLRFNTRKPIHVLQSTFVENHEFYYVFLHFPSSSLPSNQ